MTHTPRTFHVVPNTHWDREHRHAFQETRLMLVETLDEVIRILEADEHFRCFVLDGQAVALEDYLEVKPAMRPRAEALVRAGRLLIGPWYSLPDHYSVHPEAIVRNLLIGDRTCRSLGEVFRFGYSIFSFGQPAQLPQIYAGFGIDTIIYYKMYPRHLLPKSEFFWKAPDGTTSLCSRLGPYIRANFVFTFSIPVLLGGDPEKPGWEVAYEGGRKIFRLLGGAFDYPHATELEQDIRIRPELIAESAERAIWSATADSVQPDVMLGFEGNDFSRPVPQLTEALRLANEAMAGEVEFRIGSPLEYFDEFRRKTDLSGLPIVEGEMRSGPLSRQHSENLATAIRLAQANSRAEDLLIHYAEPLNVIAMMSDGGGYPEEMILACWKYLLKAQAHDSTHGIGVPKITRDTAWRLEQAEELAASLARRGFERIVRQLDTAGEEEGAVLLAVYNPLPRPLHTVLPIRLDLPAGEKVGSFHLEDMEGNRLSHYEHGRVARSLASINHENRPKPLQVDAADVDVEFSELKPCGYTVFRIRRETNAAGVDLFPFPDPVEPHSPIGRMPNILENEFLRIDIMADGTLKVHDKESKRTVEGVGLLMNSGEVGDMWIHRAPRYNEHVSALGGSARIALTRNSFLGGTFRIEITMALPCRSNERRTARSEERASVTFTTDVTLRRGSRTVEFVTAFDNRIKDHFLTARFPSGVRDGRIVSEACFETRERPATDPCSNNHGVRGTELRRFPMHRFVAMGNDTHCSAVFTRGLREFEPGSDGELIVDLSLLRAMKQNFPVHFGLFLEFEDEESQSAGLHRFEYAYYMAKGGYDPAELQEAADVYRLKPLIAQTGKGLEGRKAPLTMALIALPPASPLNLSAMKKAEDSDDIILRISNPTEREVREELILDPSFQGAAQVTMNEGDEQPLELHDGALDLTMKPFQIMTLKLPWRPAQP